MFVYLVCCLREGQALSSLSFLFFSSLHQHLLVYKRIIVHLYLL
jgi:hypothetical protein